MSKLFILTLNWNGVEKLQLLYPSLIKSLQNIDYTFLIKDNNSSDGSKELIKSWNNENIKLIECHHNNDNFSKGCNLLFDEAKANDDDLILLLNNDIIFNDNNSIDKMIDLITKDESIGVVGSKLNYINSNILQHAGVVFNTFNKYPINYRSKQIDDINAKYNKQFQAVTGAICLCKAKDYRKIRLNESYQWMFEDIDFCLSIKYKLNKKIIYCGQTNISHHESFSLKKNPVNKLFMNHNLDIFSNIWNNKYIIDEQYYKNDPNYNLYTGPK